VRDRLRCRHVPRHSLASADIKSVNLLGNVLANQASSEAACAEAILYLPDGTLTEASHSSFFAVINNQLHTTPLKANVLPSITRAYTLRLAHQANIEVVERNLARKELAEVDELFLVGTTCEVLPINTVDGKPIKSGKPGPITRRLQAPVHRERQCVPEVGSNPVQRLIFAPQVRNERLVAQRFPRDALA